MLLADQSWRTAHTCPSESCSVVSDSLLPHGLHSPGQNTGVGSFSLSRGSSQPRDETQVSHIAGGFFLPAESPGKLKNTGVGSLSLLQQIFLTQESNQGLLHCRQSLYQLSYQGSPITIEENREGTVFSEISQREKDKYCMIYLVCGI